MAYFRDLTNHRVWSVGPLTTIGRAADSDVVLPIPLSSNAHARLTWTLGQWELRDAGSRNGTWVDGERLPPLASRLLQPGARLLFGDRTQCWVFEDASAPTAFARHAHSGLEVHEEGLELQLPQGAARCDEEGVWRWFPSPGHPQVELKEDPRPVAIGEHRLYLPVPLAATPTLSRPQLEELRLHLTLERGRRNPTLALELWDRRIPLGCRADNWVYLILGRALRAGQPGGWMPTDQVVEQTGLTAPQVFNANTRLRNELEKLDVEEARRVVEGIYGQLRLNLRAEQVLEVQL